MPKPQSDSPPNSPHSEMHSPRSPKLFLVPPEGDENEGVEMGDSDTEREYLSCSGESETEADCSGMSTPSCSHMTQPAGPVGNYRVRAQHFPRGRSACTWNAIGESVFNLRSSTYLRDRQKEPSGPSLFELVDVDIMCIPEDGPAMHVAKQGDFCPRHLRRQGDNRFLLVQNWIFPPFQAILTGALNPEAPWLTTQEQTPQARLWRRFLAMDQQERNAAFKIIVAIEGGPWLLKRAVPKKPMIIGKLLQMHTHYEEGDHLEIVCDVSTGKVQEMGCGMVMKEMKRLDLGVATLMEATNEDELPEKMLFGLLIRRLDTSAVFYPDRSSE